MVAGEEVGMEEEEVKEVAGTIALFIQCNQAIVLLIHVQVLHQPLPQAIRERPDLLLQLLSVLTSEHADAILHYDVPAQQVTILTGIRSIDVRPAHAASITRQQNGATSCVCVAAHGVNIDRSLRARAPRTR